MARNTRLEDYRRRRHRVARRHRGGAHREVPRGCEDAFLALVPGGRCDPAEPAVALCAALPFLARRLRLYRGVEGLLYHQEATAVDLHVVAQAPMTGAMRLLTRRWIHQVRDLWPAFHWRVHVAVKPPPTADAYRCVFWRRP